MVLPSLARDADAPLSLQRGRNSCGSMGSAQEDTVLALRRGFCCPVARWLSVSSWSLLTASSEKVNPFSWKEKADVGFKDAKNNAGLYFIARSSLNSFFSEASPWRRQCCAHLNLHGLRGPAEGQDEDSDGNESSLHGDSRWSLQRLCLVAVDVLSRCLAQRLLSLCPHASF